MTQITYDGSVETFERIRKQIPVDFFKPSAYRLEDGSLLLQCGTKMQAGDTITIDSERGYTVALNQPPKCIDFAQLIPESKDTRHPEEALLVEWVKGNAELTVHDRTTGAYICDMLPVIQSLNHEYRRKPEPIYEWQGLYIKDGVAFIQSDGKGKDLYLTDEEFLKSDWLIKLESTKRIREC